MQNFWVDILLFIGFVVDMNYHFTGLLIHEWLGVALIVSVVVHLLLHWKWITATVKRFFSKMAGIQRLKMGVDILLFLDVVLLMMTGLLISKEVMPALGLSVSTTSRFWRVMHTTSADWMIYLIGVHLALNWKWVVNVFKKLFRIKRKKQVASQETSPTGELA